MINLIIRPVTSHVLRSIVGRPPNARKPSFSPLSLFANGEQGAWYDPSDTTTLFQDSAGTTPVTASGQPVGLMLDKSGRGHHATQPTAGSRPIYRRGDSRGVVNLLLNTETLATQSRAVTAVGHTLSFTGTGSITLSGASTAGPLVGTGVNDRVSLTFTPTAGSLTLTVSGSVTKGQLNLGPTALPYQRNDANLGGVATGASTDLHWLETDGVDDGMATGNIDFTGTDKVSIFTGLRKLSDAAIQMPVDFNSLSSGGFGLLLPPSAGASTVEVSVRRALNLFRQFSAPPAPNSLLLSANIDASKTTAAEKIRLRLNSADGTQVATNAGASDPGVFSNSPIYLFRRGGTSLPFNGWFYGLAITGRLTTDAETVATERFLGKKTAVVIP